MVQVPMWRKKEETKDWEAADRIVSKISHDPTKDMVAMDTCALGFVLF